MELNGRGRMPYAGYAGDFFWCSLFIGLIILHGITSIRIIMLSLLLQLHGYDTWQYNTGGTTRAEAHALWLSDRCHTSQKRLTTIKATHMYFGTSEELIWNLSTIAHISLPQHCSYAHYTWARVNPLLIQIQGMLAVNTSTMHIHLCKKVISQHGRQLREWLKPKILALH